MEQSSMLFQKRRKKIIYSWTVKMQKELSMK